MKALRVCEYCPFPSRPSVRSIVVTTQGRHRQKQHRAFVCADHLKKFTKKEKQP